MMTEIYKLPQGKIIIEFCDKNLSTGSLELDPKQELPKHNRPVVEELTQIEGSCVMKLIEGDKTESITLEQGQKLKIPANQFHIHSNPSDKKSITEWKFQGNIVEIIEEIRSNFRNS